MMAPAVDNTLSVLLVDDDRTFVHHLVRYLEQTPGLQVAGKAHDTRDAVHEAARLSPDVILLDWRLGGQCGVDIVPQLKQHAPSAHIIVLTTMGVSYRPFALAGGADGFVHKLQIVDDLLPEIRRVTLIQVHE